MQIWKSRYLSNKKSVTLCNLQQLLKDRAITSDVFEQIITLIVDLSIVEICCFSFFEIVAFFCNFLSKAFERISELIEEILQTWSTWAEIRGHTKLIGAGTMWWSLDLHRPEKAQFLLQKIPVQWRPKLEGRPSSHASFASLIMELWVFFHLTFRWKAKRRVCDFLWPLDEKCRLNKLYSRVGLQEKISFCNLSKQKLNFSSLI